MKAKREKKQLLDQKRHRQRAFLSVINSSKKITAFCPVLGRRSSVKTCSVTFSKFVLLTPLFNPVLTNKNLTVMSFVQSSPEYFAPDEPEPDLYFVR